MLSIAIIDTVGLIYDGDSLTKKGLGGSESAVILISKELQKIGFSVTVFNNCLSSAGDTNEGTFDGVIYRDISGLNTNDDYRFDVVISSRTFTPFSDEKYWEGGHRHHPRLFKKIKDQARLKIIWMHDTFCWGDQVLEEHLINGHVDELFTLSDFHTTYVTNCDHGNRRNFEVLKNKVFITRNGAVNYKPEVDISKKQRNLFVYNASVTKGMIPLVEDIWPKIKAEIPEAKLKIIGGYYKFRDEDGPDEQENKFWQLYRRPNNSELDIEFTGIIKQSEIAEILSEAGFFLCPGAFPETFGISSLEALLYNTPIIATRFGALEETAVEQACYFIDYAIEPNSLFTKINKEEQVNKFVQLVVGAYNNSYLHQQKMYYCNIVKDIAGWDTVALQWKQHLFKKLNHFLSVSEFRELKNINYNVHKIYGRRFSNKEEWLEPKLGHEQEIVVVSPVYNGEKYISKCIDSVVSQDYENYKHIIIEDNSSDNTANVILQKVNSLPENIKTKYVLIQNKINTGAVFNQITNIRKQNDDAIILLLDGDDWLVNDPDIFDMYNNTFKKGIEFCYGSCWSIADNIPLISQPYPENIRKNKEYRNHKFNWGLPYTHLRAFRKRLINNIDDSVFKDADGKWFKAGGDVSTFYNIIEEADSNKIETISRIVYCYNDMNPLNDYKINSEEQTKNAKMASQKPKKFSFVIPTMWRCKALFEKTLNELSENKHVNEIIIIINDMNNVPFEWKVLTHPKVKLYPQEKNIKVNPAWNLGVSVCKNDLICLLNDDIWFDMRLLDKLVNRISEDDGVYGMITGESHFNHPPSTDYSISIKEWNPGENIHGFGQMMFFHKKNWKPIIDGLEIYFGDDFIFYNQLLHKRKNYMIYNIKFESPMAATTSDKNIVGGYLERESIVYSDWVKNNPIVDILEQEYNLALKTPSDINQHLPQLKLLADECETVVELGVRTGVSTRALLNSKCKNLHSYDLFLDNRVVELFDIARRNGKNCSYEQNNSLTMTIPETDLLFIDTDHTYDQLSKELSKHHHQVRKYIAFHDTFTFGLKTDQNPTKGIFTALVDFMIQNPEWKFKYHSSENNGFTVIEKKSNNNIHVKKILIAIPTAKYIESETFKSIYDLEVPNGYKIDFQYFYGYNVEQIRNLIAHWAERYDYLFSVDSDITFPKDTLKKLLQHDKDMVSGLYIQRKPNNQILEIYRNGKNVPYEQLKNQGLVEVDSCGFGCVLVKSKVIRDIGYPQFVYKSTLDHKNAVSEDTYFCLKAKEKGYKVYADTSILCGHIGSYTFEVRDILNNETDSVVERLRELSKMPLMPQVHYEYLKSLKIQPKVIYDIGACVLHWTSMAKYIWPNAKYIPFEAMAECRVIFEENNLHDFKIGVLSDVDGKLVEFYENKMNPGGNSYYRENEKYNKNLYNENNKIVKVSFTLDTVVKQSFFPLPDLIKMDIQGAEMDVLKGAKMCLEHCQDLILELQKVEYNTGAPLREEVIEYVRSLGFEMISGPFCDNGPDGDYHFRKLK